MRSHKRTGEKIMKESSYDVRYITGSKTLDRAFLGTALLIVAVLVIL